MLHSPSQLLWGVWSTSGTGFRMDANGGSSGMRCGDSFLGARLAVAVCAPTVRLLLLCTFAREMTNGSGR